MIALVDSRCAKEGYEFIYLGVSEECGGCGLRLPCHHNLERGRKYAVTEVRDKSHPCPVFGEVTVCEVQEPSVDAAIEAKGAFPGSSVSFRPQSCGEVFCSHAGYCAPEGLREGDRCTVVELKREIECRDGRRLVIAALRRV